MHSTVPKRTRRAKRGTKWKAYTGVGWILALWGLRESAREIRSSSTCRSQGLLAITDSAPPPLVNVPVPQEHGMCRRLEGDWMPWLPNTGLQSKHTTVVGSEGRLSTLSSTVTTGASGRAWRWRGRMPGPRARAGRRQCTASGVESREVGMQTTTHCPLCESQQSHAPGLGVVRDDLPLLGKTSVKRAATGLRGAT